MTEELLQCPMCAGKATLSKWESPIGVHEEVRCFKCGTSNPIVKFWNTRAQPKYKRVDLAIMKEPATAVRIAEYTQGYGDGYNRAIDDIKAKYGDLYTLTKEGE
jgi:Zn ribbon nucleic-acid-binding protein